MLTFWIGQHCWWSPTVQQVVSRPKQQELSGQVLFSSPHSGESTKSPDDYNFLASNQYIYIYIYKCYIICLNIFFGNQVHRDAYWLWKGQQGRYMQAVVNKIAAATWLRPSLFTSKIETKYFGCTKLVVQKPNLQSGGIIKRPLRQISDVRYPFIFLVDQNCSFERKKTQVSICRTGPMLTPKLNVLGLCCMQPLIRRRQPLKYPLHDVLLIYNIFKNVKREDLLNRL